MAADAVRAPALVTGTTGTSGLCLGASGAGFNLLRQRESPGVESLRAPEEGRKYDWSSLVYTPHLQ